MQVGQAVRFQRSPGVVVDALVIGVEGDNLHLAFVHPDRVQQLGGAEWKLAFDRAWSVVPANSAECLATGKGFRPLYTKGAIDSRDLTISNLRTRVANLQSELAKTSEGKDAALQALADANAAKPKAKAKAEPTSEPKPEPKSDDTQPS